LLKEAVLTLNANEHNELGLFALSWSLLNPVQDVVYACRETRVSTSSNWKPAKGCGQRHWLSMSLSEYGVYITNKIGPRTDLLPNYCQSTNTTCKDGWHIPSFF